MIKLQGSINRKVPVGGMDFSSLGFGASMEVSISSDDPKEVREKLRQIFASLGEEVDAQIKAKSNELSATERQLPAPAQPAANNRYAKSTPAQANGTNGSRVMASVAQCRAVFGICKSLNYDIKAVLADLNVADARELTVKQASILIDKLKKAQQNGNGVHN